MMSESRSSEHLDRATFLRLGRLVRSFIRGLSVGEVALLSMLLAGCATDTIARRKQERLAAYSALPVSHQVAADQGRLLHGMSTNAVYIAWGQPSEITSEGPTTIWIYRAEESREHKHTTIYTTPGGVVVPEEVKVPYARNVVRARVTFESGLVTSWSRTPASSGEQFQ